MLSVFVVTLALANPIYERDEEEISAYLNESSSRHTAFTEHLKGVILDTVGTPYQDGPLGEGESGKFDTDPLIDLRKVDCVTYVEQTVAMATSNSYEDLVQNLQRIRYRNGEVGFEHRNHFMISDWIKNNSWCRDVTSTLPVDTLRLERTISKKDFFEKVKAPGLGLSEKNEQVVVNVVPPGQTSAVEKNIPDGSLIVFVGKIDWLFALHCGVYIRDEHGKGSLVHASSKAGEVISMSLAKYMEDQKNRYLGFSVYEMDRPDWTK